MVLSFGCSNSIYRFALPRPSINCHTHTHTHTYTHFRYAFKCCQPSRVHVSTLCLYSNDPTVPWLQPSLTEKRLLSKVFGWLICWHLTCLTHFPDGRAVRNETKDKILAIKEKYPHFNPHLAMIQVGAREDSSIYVKMKDKAAKEVR